MSSLIETFTTIYPEQLFLEISPEDIEAASKKPEVYSYDVARRHGLINCLVLNRFFTWLNTEAPIEETPNVWPNVEDLPTVWEFVNGSALTIGNTRLVLIPQEAIDTDELCVPQEWVDLPEWVADYYLGVQVNLEQNWLRVWGFTSHKTLKEKAEYDPVLRNYCLDGELLIADLTVMWAACHFRTEEKVEVAALPSLSYTEFEEISRVLRSPRSYSPRLLVTDSQPIDDSEVAFPLWGALMAKDNLRRQLYEWRVSSVTGVEPGPTVSATLSNWFAGQFEELWLPLEQILNPKWGRAKWGNARSGSAPIKIERGKILDFGYRLNGEKVALAIAIEPYTDRETKVIAQVRPIGEELLPVGLKLRVELESDGGEEVAREGAKFVQLGFSELPGRTFRVEVSLEGEVITEEFVV